MEVFLAAVCSCCCHSALWQEFHCVIGRGRDCALVQTPWFWTVCALGPSRAGCLGCYTLESHFTERLCDQSGA